MALKRSALWLGAAGMIVTLTTSASAQSTQNYSSGNNWGTQPTGVAVPGMVDSAIAHNQNGQAAALVNSAKKGLLLGGPGMSITAIGSQSIVSNTIVGSDNDVSISASQSTSNSGSVSNQGTFNN